MASVVLTASDAAWAWSVTGGATEVIAEAIGGGGGGGGETGYPAAGGGGMGGGYAKTVITKGAETTLNIVVGAAGTAGSGGNGGNGGYSQITQDVTVVLRAPGGGGGGGATSNNHSGAAGTTANGVAVGSVVTRTGGNGAAGVYSTAISGGGGGAAGATGNGGNASGATAGAHGGGNFLNGVDYCSLGAAGRTTSENNGIAGPGVGAGGSGGLCTDSTNHTGGAGYRGVVVLTWNDPVSVADSFKHTDTVAVSVSDLQWIKLLLSDNVAASAATHTTTQLTAPAGKDSGDFQEGHISDDTNPITSTDLDVDLYTELEWSLQTQGIAENDEVEFRITDAGSDTLTLSVTPKITGGTGVTHLSINVSDCTSQETQIGA